MSTLLDNTRFVKPSANKFEHPKGLLSFVVIAETAEHPREEEELTFIFLPPTASLPVIHT